MNANIESAIKFADLKAGAFLVLIVVTLASTPALVFTLFGSERVSLVIKVPLGILALVDIGLVVRCVRHLLDALAPTALLGRDEVASGRCIVDLADVATMDSRSLESALREADDDMLLAHYAIHNVRQAKVASAKLASLRAAAKPLRALLLTSFVIVLGVAVAAF